MCCDSRFHGMFWRGILAQSSLCLISARLGAECHRPNLNTINLRSYLGATGLETDECEQHMALCKPFLSIRHHRMMWPAFRSGDLCVYAPLRKPVYSPVSRELSQFPAEYPSDKEI